MIGDVGPSVLLDGSGYLRIPVGGGDAAALDVRLGSYSVGCAITVTTAQAAGLYSKADAGALNGIMLELLNSTTVRGRVHGITASAGIGTLADTLWHWLALVLDRQLHVLRLYLDGAEIAQVSTSSISATDLNTTVSATWGAYSDGSAKFVGQLARMTVAPGVAWTSEQVAEQWRALVCATQNTATARIISRPQVTTVAPQSFDGIPAYEALSAALWNGDGALTPWLDGEVRGVPVHYHLYDLTTGEWLSDVFVGELAGLAQQGPVLQLTASALPLHRLTDVVPRPRVLSPIVVATDADPADVTPATVGSAEYQTAQDYGAVLSRGWGFCEALIARNLAWGTDANGDVAPSYRYAVAAGNWAIGLVSLGGSASVDTAQWDADYRAMVDGEPCTVITIGSEPQAGETMLVAARRLPDVTAGARLEWDWMLGFEERFTRLPTRPGTMLGASGLTAASLRSDSITEGMGITDSDGVVVGAFLGAVQFNGTSDYLEAGPVAQALKSQEFHVTFLITPDDAQSGTILNGPFTPLAVGDVPSWRIRWNAAGGGYEFLYRTSVGGEVMAWSTLDPWRGEHVVTIVKEADQVSFWIDGALDTVQTVGMVPIQYPTTGIAAFLFGRAFSTSVTDWFKGKLGYVRVGLGVPTAREIEAAHYTLRASPVEALRELLERDLGLVCDEASWSNALRTCADVAGSVYPHALRVDGAIQATTPATEAIGAITRLRDMRLGVGDAGITLTIPTAAVRAVAAYEVGGQRNNIVGLPSRVRPSTAEAVRQLIVAYDRAADPLTGTSGAYRHGLEFALAPIGRDAVTIELPLVRSHRCADIVGEWLQKRLKQRTQRFRFAVGHEARARRLGDVVQATLPHFQRTAMEAEVVGVGLAGPLAELDVVPYDPSLYTYAAGRTLPTSPVVVHQTLVPGANPSLAWDGTARTLSVRLETIVTEAPTTTIRENWDTVTGAATHLAAVSDASDSSYIETPDDFDVDLFTAPGALPTLPAGWGVAEIRIRARARYANTGSGTLRKVQLVSQADGGTADIVAEYDTTTSFADYEVALPQFPALSGQTARGWLGADVPRHAFGVRAFTDGSGETIRVSRVQRIVALRALDEKPRGFGFCKVWVRASGAAAPIDGIDPARTIESLVVPLGEVVTGSSYSVWVTVYDVANRAIVALGPLTFTA